MYAIYGNIGGILMVNVTIYSIHGSYGYGVVLSNILGIIIIYYGNSYYPTSTQGRHKQALAATDQMYNRGMFNGHSLERLRDFEHVKFCERMGQDLPGFTPQNIGVFDAKTVFSLFCVINMAGKSTTSF